MWYQCNTVVKVALRKESVDRNTENAVLFLMTAVALRKESVDRNWQDIDDRETIAVALRKESVDRNLAGGQLVDLGQKSLSARRAWIEITNRHCCSVWRSSLSARRAWIEILWPCHHQYWAGVALRKESVDRNMVLFVPELVPWCRSPQGERG